ncbi:unnamed protein product [Absidia cylindrospora]
MFQRNKKPVAIDDSHGLAFKENLRPHICSLTNSRKCLFSPSIGVPYFVENRRAFLQWGDTVSVPYKKLNFGLRLELRMLLETEQEELEAVTGKVASAHSTMASKL